MTILANGVPDTRRINGQELTSDIQLTPELIKALGANVETVTTQDWNTIIKPGCYCVTNATGLNRPGIAGYPPFYSYGHLLVMSSGGGNGDLNVTQIYFQEGRSGLFYRNRWDGSWRDWRFTRGTDSFHINYSIDLNTLTSGAEYNMYRGSGVEFTNAPPDFDFGTLQVIGRANYSQSFVTQILTWRSDGRQMIRTRNDGSMNWQPWRKIYSEAQKPSAADLDLYSKQDIDNKVLKTVTLQAPEGVVAGKYYPILISGGFITDVQIWTKSANGGDRMNNNSFCGTILVGGWSDRPKAVYGVYTAYETSERAILGIAAGTTDAQTVCVVYVEGSAFPVSIKLSGYSTVTTSATDISVYSSTFKAGVPLDTPQADLGTNVIWLAEFKSGNGLYFNSNKYADPVTGNSSNVVTQTRTVWTGSLSQGQSITLPESISGRTVYFGLQGTNTTGIILPPGDNGFHFNCGSWYYNLVISNNGRTILLQQCLAGAGNIIKIDIVV